MISKRRIERVYPISDDSNGKTRHTGAGGGYSGTVQAISPVLLLRLLVSFLYIDEFVLFLNAA